MELTTGLDTPQCDACDRALLQAVEDGLPLVPRPFAELGIRLGMTEVR